MSWKPAPSRSRRTKSSRGSGGGLAVVPMGQVLRIEYRKKGQRGDVRSVHDFKRSTPLYRTRDGRMLVIAPVKATHEIKD